MKKLLLMAVLMLTVSSEAGYGASWYLAYTVQGGSITHYKGPYNSQVECLGHQTRIPIGATFVGCFQ